MKDELYYIDVYKSRAAVVHLNFRAGSTFPVPVCTVPYYMDRTSRCHKVDAVRLYASCRLNLLLSKGQICVTYMYMVYCIYKYYRWPNDWNILAAIFLGNPCIPWG